MEEKPPTQDRDVPRSRTPRAAFSTPEQPVPPTKPAERATRRAAKPAPPVTFQPPTSDSTGTAEAAPEQPSGRPATRRPQPQRAEKSAPARTRPAKPETASKAAKPKAGPQPAEPKPAAQPEAAAEPKPTVQPAAEPRPATEPQANAEPTPGATPDPVKASPRRRTTEPRPPAATTPAKATPAPRATKRQPSAKATTPQATPDSAQATPPRKTARKTTRPAGVKPEQPPGPQTQTQVQAEVPEIKPEPPAPIPAAAETERVSLPPDAADTPARSPRTEAWAKLVADPGHAPELLALAATQTIGPRAQDWAARHREAYPHATPAGLARLATKQFTRFGTLASIFGAVAGSYAPIALLGSAALSHAELVLHLAAAYGLDPTDERRAAELLVLTRVHPTLGDAEEALAAARQPAYEEGGVTDAAWRFGRMAATQAGGWAALRVINRLFPGTSLLVATAVSGNAVAALGTRAMRFYSQSSQDAGSRV